MSRRHYMARSEVKPASHGERAHQFVFAYLPGNIVTPYVTWRRNTGDGATYWGHYFSSPDDAIDDYLDRCENAGLDPKDFKECFACGGRAVLVAYAWTSRYGDSAHTYTEDVPVEHEMCQMCFDLSDDYDKEP